MVTRPQDGRAAEPAGAHKPEATGNVKVTRPMNGNEFLESLRDDRTIYIYGERVKDVTDASGVPQHRAHDRALLRRAARSRRPRTS